MKYIIMEDIDDDWNPSITNDSILKPVIVSFTGSFNEKY